MGLVEEARMSEHEHTEPEKDEREEDVADLEVPEGEQEDVAGGADSSGHKEWIEV